MLVLSSRRNPPPTYKKQQHLHLQLHTGVFRDYVPLLKYLLDAVDVPPVATSNCAVGAREHVSLIENEYSYEYKVEDLLDCGGGCSFLDLDYVVGTIVHSFCGELLQYTHCLVGKAKNSSYYRLTVRAAISILFRNEVDGQWPFLHRHKTTFLSS